MKSPPVSDANRPKSMSRRALLRGGITAMPVILTLQSGAALARSSNMIAAATPDSKDSLGRTLCLDTNSVYPSSDSGQTYDLGDPPQADINIITDRKYRLDKNLDKNYKRFKVSEGTMCQRGGTYWYNDKDGQGWQSVQLPQNGIVVSSGAMTSMADHIVDTLI